MSLPTQIQLIYPEINDVDFLDTIRLQDDGSGPYIAAWNHPTLPQPTQAQLDAVADQAAEMEAAEQSAAAARKVWPTAAAFLGEFTLPELAAISLSTDPTVAALRLLLASWPSDVWSDDPRIMLGMEALVLSGVIDAARRDEIEEG